MSRLQELRDQAAEHRRLGDSFMRKRQFQREQRDRYRNLCDGDFGVSDEERLWSEQGVGSEPLPPQYVFEQHETLMRGYGEVAERQWALARKLSQDAYRLETGESLVPGEVLA